MSDAEDFTFSSELLRRKIKPGKFSRSCRYYRKHVILDIFQNAPGIWETILPRYCLAQLIDIFMFAKSIRPGSYGMVLILFFSFEWKESKKI